MNNNSTIYNVHHLDNGLKIINIPRKSADFISVQVWVNTGSANEDVHNNGVSHFLEHLVFNGSENYLPNQIDELVESLGGSMNAATSHEYTFYYIDLPSKHIEKAFHVLSDMTLRATFNEEELEKERLVVIQEIERQFSSPTASMWKALFAKSAGYANKDITSPYQRDIIGPIDNIKTLSRSEIIDYYKSQYQPSNMTVIVAGNVEADLVCELSKKYFKENLHNEKGGSSSKPIAYIPDDKFAINKDELFTIEKDVSNKYQVIAFNTKGYSDLTAHTAINIMTTALIDGEYSPIFNKYRNELQLLNDISLSEFTFKHTGVLYCYFIYPENGEVSEADASQLENIAESILNDLRKVADYITDEDIERAKNTLLSSYAFELDDVSSLANSIGFHHTIKIEPLFDDYVNCIKSLEKEKIITEFTKIVNQSHLQLILTKS